MDVFPLRSPTGPDFTSIEQAVSQSALVRVRHGFGRPPAFVHVGLRCLVAEFGYTPGDEEYSLVNVGVAADENDVIIIQPPLFQVWSHTLFGPVNATEASWRWIVRAWRYH